MKKVFLLAISAAFTFAACKDTKAEATSTDAATTEMHAGHEDHSGHDHATEAPVTTNQATSAASPDVKLNPPHGEPGHRCEIAVGAPLDGSATPAQNTPKAAPQQTNSSQGFLSSGNNQAATPPATPAQAVQQSGAAQQTAPGMKGKPNPAHGQPGHRCDVQVGQPLP